MGKAKIVMGRLVSGLVVVLMLLDAAGKFMKPPQVVEAFTRLGVPISTAFLIGALLTASTVLYAIPRTEVLGAVLLTGYLGGAVAIHVRAGSTLFETVFPALFSVFAWIGIAVRRPEVRAVLTGHTGLRK